MHVNNKIRNPQPSLKARALPSPLALGPLFYPQLAEKPYWVTDIGATFSRRSLGIRKGAFLELNSTVAIPAGSTESRFLNM